MDDQSLRNAFASVSRRVPATREACPTPEALHELATTTGDTSDRLAMLRHVSTCGACRSDFDLLRTAVQAAPVSVTKRSPRWLPSLAAAVLLATAGTIVLKQPPRDDVTRGGPGDGAIRMVQVITTTNSVNMTWHAVPNAVRYRVDVMTRDGSIAYTTETADTVASGTLSGGAIAQWSVTAVLLDGTERSATFTERDLPRGSTAPR